MILAPDRRFSSPEHVRHCHFLPGWIRLLFAGILGLLLFASCIRKEPGVYIKLAGFTQGTSYHITYQSPDSLDYGHIIDSLLHVFDLSLSTYDSSSLISAINCNRPYDRIDFLVRRVIRVGKDVYERSGGAFDMTVAPVVNAWGFGFTERASVDSALIDSLLMHVGMDKIRIREGKLIKDNPGIMLDVNGIAQGYSADYIAGFLEYRQIRNYLVEIGGEVKAKGRNEKGKIWRVGIDKPVEGNLQPGRHLQAIVRLKNQSLATSGNYRRFYVENGVKYAHTIDPETGFPVRHNLLSATVLSRDCIVADAWATAFMVMGLDSSMEVVEKDPGLEAYFIYNDEAGNFRVKHTSGMKKFILAD